MSDETSKKRKDHYVEIIQQTHKKLRQDLHEGLDFNKVWKSHIEDKETLKQYSISMKNLAEEIWDNTKVGKDRTLWCKNFCEKYFLEGGFIKHLNKDKRRRTFYELNDKKGFHCGPNPFTTCSESITNSNVSLTWDKTQIIKLLDVGSCFNPFKNFNIFKTIAVDLLPANKYVLKCDFLSVPISKNENWKQPNTNLTENSLKQEAICKKNIDNEITTFAENYFDVVVFSLLLTYIPCPEKRLILCKQAYKTLKSNGLLLIVTPDSCHQNKHAKIMKQWKFSIEKLGFERVKYEKDEHLHLLAFRKVPDDYLWDNKLFDIYGQSEKGLFIPQDLNHKK